MLGTANCIYKYIISQLLLYNNSTIYITIIIIKLVYIESLIYNKGSKVLDLNGLIYFCGIAAQAGTETIIIIIIAYWATKLPRQCGWVEST